MKTTLIKHFSRHLRLFFEHWVVGTTRAVSKKTLLSFGLVQLGKIKMGKRRGSRGRC
jgi:hypothetical protein